MRFPRYQWLQEPPNNVCGYCDELAIPDDVNPKFQLISESIDTTSELFDTNPFDEITSTTLTFKITVPVILSGVQLYIGDKAYIMEYDSTLFSSHYTYTTQGNIYFVRLQAITAGVGPTLRMIDFLNDIVDVNHGTTSSNTSNTVQIINVPADSYFNIYDDAIFVTGTTPSTNLGRFFYYTGSGVAYKNICRMISASTYYEFQDALSVTDIVRYAIEYNATYNDFEFEITVDDGVNPVTTIPATISAYTLSLIHI